MIFGTKFDESKYSKSYDEDIKWFAWYPVRLKDGRRVWLQMVYYRRFLTWDGSGCEYFLSPKKCQEDSH